MNENEARTAVMAAVTEEERERLFDLYALRAAEEHGSNDVDADVYVVISFDVDGEIFNIASEVGARVARDYKMEGAGGLDTPTQQINFQRLVEATLYEQACATALFAARRARREAFKDYCDDCRRV